MNYIGTTNGFSLAKGGVSFDFVTELRPQQTGELLRFSVKGSAPIPTLLDGDRLLLPVGEGIALTVGEDNLVPNANGDFCSKLGTMSMVIVERGGKFQAPCLFIDGKPLYESLDIIDWLKAHPQA